MSKQAKGTSLSQALNSGVRKYGTSIISNLTIAAKTSQLYGFAHQNVTEALTELCSFIESFIKLEGDTEISRVDEFLFINEVRVKVDLGGMQPYEYVVNVMRDREIGTITFREGIDEDSLSRFIGFLNSTASLPEENLWKSVHEAFRQTGLECIDVTQYSEKDEEPKQETDDIRILASSAYFSLVKVLDETFEAIRQGKKINIKRLKRAIQYMVDLLLDDSATFLALVNIRDFGSRLASHSVNVAVLSVALGTKLGFSKKHLGDLGFAALLHDIGKVEIPEHLHGAVISQLDREEADLLRDHVYTGVDRLLSQRISDAVVKGMNVTFLHHFRYDGTGFPRTQAVDTQNAYSRIVSIANTYDNLARRGLEGTEPMPPDQILRYLTEGGGTEFDPLVVKAFSNIMGLYPVGSIVCLDTGELASVKAPPANARYLDRPTVHIFKDASGAPTEKTVNLLDRGPTGEFSRSILKLYQQDEIHLELDEFLCVL